MPTIPNPTQAPQAHRVFVYGSLRAGEYNHRGDFASSAKLVAEGVIRGATLVSLGVYPAIISSDDQTLEVIGEVYDLPEKTFKWIEAMELGAGYRRDPVKVLTGKDVVEADAYFFANPARLDGQPRVEGGDWVAYRHADDIASDSDEEEFG